VRFAAVEEVAEDIFAADALRAATTRSAAGTSLLVAVALVVSASALGALAGAAADRAGKRALLAAIAEEPELARCLAAAGSSSSSRAGARSGGVGVGLGLSSRARVAPLPLRSDADGDPAADDDGKRSDDRRNSAIFAAGRARGDAPRAEARGPRGPLAPMARLCGSRASAAALLSLADAVDALFDAAALDASEEASFAGEARAAAAAAAAAAADGRGGGGRPPSRPASRPASRSQSRGGFSAAAPAELASLPPFLEPLRADAGAAERARVLAGALVPLALARWRAGAAGALPLPSLYDAAVSRASCALLVGSSVLGALAMAA
jgi:hypothetical protein